MPSSRSTWGTRLSANIVSWSRSAKFGDARPVQVGGGDLGPLEERKRELVVAARVGEALPGRQVVASSTAEPSAASIRAANAAGVAQAGAEIAQRAREQLDQLVVGILAEDRASSAGVERGRAAPAVHGPWPSKRSRQAAAIVR